jgi:cyclophilin family peptidyl-prolyl cis-trans isomerase
MAAAAWVLASLTACGGGGSGGGQGTPGTVNQPPVAVARLSGEAVLQGTTRFDTAGTADPDGTIASRSWAYGDGNTGTADSHVYATTGNFVATLTVTDNLGASASTSVPVTVVKCSAAGVADAARSPYPTVCVQTDRGEMVFELYEATGLAPTTAANFLRYVDDGFYNGIIFHRVMPGFVIQAGGYTPGPTYKAPTRPTIALENRNALRNWRFTLAMARTSAPDSATSQFYINLVDNPDLDFNPSLAVANGYAVFGQVISGTAVVDIIGSVATRTTTASGGPVTTLADVPVQDVVIRSIVRLP